MQRDVRARPGVRCRRQVVGVGFAGYLEHAQADFVSQDRAVLEPLAVSPGLHHCFSVGIAVFGFFSDIVERVEHQQGVLELLGGNRGQLCVIQHLNQSHDVVAALHGAKQFYSALFADQRGGRFTFGDGGQKAGFYVSSFVNTRRNAVGDQVNEEFFFAGWRVFQQLDQACSLFGVKRLGNDTQCCALFDMFAVGFKHSYYPHHWSQMGVRDAHPGMQGTHALRGFLSRLARVAEIPNRSCFQSFTPAERRGETCWCEHLHCKGSSPTPFFRINCARDALKTASNGHWRLKRQADSTVKTC